MTNSSVIITQQPARVIFSIIKQNDYDSENFHFILKSKSLLIARLECGRL